MITALRFVMLLSLALWIGSIFFFAIGVAPTVFAVLPTRTLAGNVVTRSLTTLHWLGLACGMAFLASSLLLHVQAPTSHLPVWRHVLIILMLLLTLGSQFGIMPKMAALRTGMGEIDTIAADDPRRIQFNALHQWSTRIEGTVLLMGLAVLGAVARQQP